MEDLPLEIFEQLNLNWKDIYHFSQVSKKCLDLARAYKILKKKKESCQWCLKHPPKGCQFCSRCVHESKTECVKCRKVHQKWFDFIQIVNFENPKVKKIVAKAHVKCSFKRPWVTMNRQILNIYDGRLVIKGKTKTSYYRWYCTVCKNRTF